MTQNINLFGIHAQALVLRSYRSEILASNLANANTPHFKARDIDFNGILEQQINGNDEMTGRSLTLTNPGHIPDHDNARSGMTADLLYRQPGQPSLDSNTVNSQTENSEFLNNSIRYQASLEFINSRVRSLLGALKGE